MYFLPHSSHFVCHLSFFFIYFSILQCHLSWEIWPILCNWAINSSVIAGGMCPGPKLHPPWLIESFCFRCVGPRRVLRGPRGRRISGHQVLCMEAPGSHMLRLLWWKVEKHKQLLCRMWDIFSISPFKWLFAISMKTAVIENIVYTTIIIVEDIKAGWLYFQGYTGILFYVPQSFYQIIFF